MVIKNREEKYVRESQKYRLWVYYIIYGFSFALMVSVSVYALIDGESLLSFIKFSITISFGLFSYFYYGIGNFDKIRCRSKTGVIREKTSPFRGFSLSGEEVIIPQHWLCYIPKNKALSYKVVDLVGGNVISENPYIVSVENGLSINDEYMYGVKNVLDPKVNALKYLTCAFGYILSFMGVLFFFAIPEEPVLAFEAGFWAYAVSFLPGACSGVATVLDLRRRRKIYRMYEEKGVDGLSLSARRWLRLRGAAIGGVIASVFGPPFLYLFPGANPSVVVLVIVVSIPGAALLVTPRPTENEDEVGALS